jgi:hypothetical protein
LSEFRVLVGTDGNPSIEVPGRDPSGGVDGGHQRSSEPAGQGSRHQCCCGGGNQADDSEESQPVYRAMDLTGDHQDRRPVRLGLERCRNGRVGEQGSGMPGDLVSHEQNRRFDQGPGEPAAGASAEAAVAVEEDEPDGSEVTRAGDYGELPVERSPGDFDPGLERGRDGPRLAGQFLLRGGHRGPADEHVAGDRG